MAGDDGSDQGDESGQTLSAAPVAARTMQSAPQAAKSGKDQSPPVPPEGILTDQDQVQICHAKGHGQGTADDPYVLQTPNVDGIDNHKNPKSSHMSHVGDIPYGDIIPPFKYEKNGETFTVLGLNWTTEGRAIWGNFCNPVTPEPEPDPGTPELVIQTPPCVAEGHQPPATVAVTVTGITEGNKKPFTLSMSNGGSFSDTFTLTTNGTYTLDTQPGWFGTYTVTISLDGVVKDSGQVLIQRCATPEPANPPVIVIDFDQCSVSGEIPSEASVSISKLANGKTYSVTLEGPNGPVYSGNVVGGETDASFMMPLDGVGEYTFTLALGEWSKSQQFQVNDDCPPVPVTPTLVVNVPDCFVAGDVPEAITVGVTEFSGLGHGKVRLMIEGDGWSDTQKVAAAGDYSVPIAGPGDYTLTLYKGEAVYDEVHVTIAECPPPEPTTPPSVHISFEQCLVTGEMPTSAAVVIQYLVPGTEYGVSLMGPDGETFADTIVGTELATELTVPLAGAGEYSFALTQGEVTDNWAFTVDKDCKVTPVPPKPPVNPTPVVKVTPPAVKPALAVTGSEPLTGLIAGATFLVLVSGALMLAGRRQKQG